MINLDDPEEVPAAASGQAHQVAMNMLRPISRKYDRAEHEYPKELDMLAAMIDGLSESGAAEGAGAAGVRRDEKAQDDDGVKNGTNLASVMSIQEMCWGDVGLLLSMPRQGLGNSAIARVAERRAAASASRACGPAMAITEPGTGSDSANIKTTATPRRRRVRPQRREDLRDLRRPLRRRRRVGDARPEPGPRGDQVVRGAEGHARACGWSGSSTSSASGPPTPPRSSSRTAGCPTENLLGSPEVDVKQGFAGAMATFDNTRPLVAAMAVGCAQGRRST